MKKSSLLAVSLVALPMSVPAPTTQAQTVVTVVERPDTTGRFDHYVANRAPLVPSFVVKLPVGAVRPAGWLKRQLELQAGGFHGRLTEISAFLKKENNAWLSKTGVGDHGWEEPPYWLKGFIGNAYLLENERMLKEAQL